MAVSESKQANERYRSAVVEKLMQFFRSAEGGEEWVIQVANNAFGFPFVNDLGDDEIVKITVSIPTGDRDGNPYDLDAEGESYQMSVKKKAEIAQKKAEAKAKKIEADRKKREAMAKLKAKQEQGAE
jgi:hypothetical protein